MRTVICLFFAAVSPVAFAFSCYQATDSSRVSLLYPESVTEVGTLRVDDFESVVFCDRDASISCQLEDDGGRFELDLTPGQEKLLTCGRLGRGLRVRPSYELRRLDAAACKRMFPRRSHIEF